MEFTSILLTAVLVIAMNSFVFWYSNRSIARERDAHRQETRAMLQRLGVPVPQQLPTPYKPPAEPKGRWLSDPEGLDPIFIPAED